MPRVYPYILKRKLSDVLNQGKHLSITIHCEQSEVHSGLFVNNEFFELLEPPYEYTLEYLITNALNLSYEGYHEIDIKGDFELTDNNLFFRYDLKEINRNPINYEGVTMDIVEAYVKEHTKYLTGKILLLGSEYDNEDGYKRELAQQQEIFDNEMKAQNATLPTEKQLQRRLSGEQTEQIQAKVSNNKPWWRFW